MSDKVDVLNVLEHGTHMVKLTKAAYICVKPYEPEGKDCYSAIYSCRRLGK